MKKILLIGGSGFVGKNIYEYLRVRYKIYAPNSREMNALDEQQVYRCLKAEKPDIVINATDLKSKEYNYFENRLRIYMNLEKYSDYYKKQIYFGSGAEYGRTLPVKNVKENEFGRIIPQDTYGFCLHQMSMHAINSEKIYNLRLFGIFGKYELWESRFISNAICKALCGFPITIRKNTVFDYLYIDDLCKIVEWVVENKPIYHDYNAVSGGKYELKKIAEIINNQSGQEQVPILIATEDVGKEYTGSNARILKEMKNFTVEPLGDSINKLIHYYKKHLNNIDKEKLLYN